MRLINSDGQVCDARIMAKDGGSANSNSLRIELGGLALVAALVVMLLTTGIAVWSLADSRHTRDLADVRHEEDVMQSAALNARISDVQIAAQRADRDSSLLAYYVNEVDGKLIHAGLIEPRERWSPARKAAMSKQLEKHP